MIFVTLCVIVSILVILHCYFKYNERARIIRKIPSGFDEHFLLGNTLGIFKKPEELFNLPRRLAKINNGIYGFYSPIVISVGIYNPEDIEIVISGTKHMEKGLAYNILRGWLADGLLVSSGSKWLQRRKILTPTFHFNILKQFFITLEENGERLVNALRETRGESVDVVPVLSEYTLNSICETAMGTRLHEETNNAARQYKNTIYDLGQLFVERFAKLHMVFQPIFNMSSLGRQTKEKIKIVHAFTKRVIQERKEYIENNDIEVTEESVISDDIYMAGKKKRVAMLDLLIAAEKKGVIDSQGIQEEVDTFMFEGHDTTASGLTFIMVLLANHKNIQDKVYEELKEIFGSSDRSATMEDLSAMKYLECCVKESLRLYPPVHVMTRKISETTQLTNYTLPAGTECYIHTFDLHRREDLFKNALVFDPDRFLPENSINRHPYAYIPFSAGPRNCIGQKFAMMEMKSCVANILRNFELHPVTKLDQLEFTSDLVLRTTHPVCVKFVERFNK